LNPTWGELFEFDVYSNSPKSFVISVYDWDQFGGDDTLGTVTVDFSDFKDDERKDMWFTLNDQDGKPMSTGEIHIEITYYVN